MRISDFENKEIPGMYKHDGIDHEDVESLLHSGFLGFCMCGTPDDNLIYIREGLRLLNEKGPESPSGLIGDEWHEWFEDYQARKLKHFGSNEANHFFCYWADKEGYTEHGGSVLSPWLTDAGQNLLDMLDEFKGREP